MFFRDGLGRYMGDGSEFFTDEDECYYDVKCPYVCFSENDKNYIGISLDDCHLGDSSYTLS